MGMKQTEIPGSSSQRWPAAGLNPEASSEAIGSRSSRRASSLADSTDESSRASFRPANHPQRSVELHIEELVLDGFSPADRHAVGEAVERELARLLTEQDGPTAITQSIERDHLNVGAISLPPGSKAEATGVQLARAIYRGLGK
jgi:hypothetical protein